MNISHPRTIAGLLLVFCLCLSDTFGQTASKRRADSFFGIHFDFHAGAHDTLIGRRLTESMIDSLLVRTKPDYIQVDTKGHWGVASYPTRLGNGPSKFTRDPLKIFREVTRKHGVALYGHYSGIWDTQAIQNHPHWARINADSSREKHKVSLWSAYPDSLLIPQLKELSDYGLDGVWVDGDCWALECDFRPDALQDFSATTGITAIPPKPGTDSFRALQDFSREKFRAYLQRYVDQLHQYNPGFQVTSNWAYSSIMPEPVGVDIDFISGDLSPNNSVVSGAFEARFIAPQGKSWDLMSWSFGGNNSPKSAIQLCQEASQVLAMGGGFQAYWQQYRDASLPSWAFETMGQLADFCRARQPFCQNSTPIPQVVIYFSDKGFRLNTQKVYGGDHPQIKGVLQLLMDNQLPVEIRMAATLKDNMQNFPLIVVPEWEFLDTEEIQKLETYARNGGTLLVIGSKAVKNFEHSLGVKLEKILENGVCAGNDGRITGSNKRYQSFIPSPGTQVFGSVYSGLDPTTFIGPAATISQLGKGKVAAIYVDIAEIYGMSTPYVLRKFIGDFARTLFDPMVTVENASPFVNVTLNQKGDATIVNLLNVSGAHKTAASFDEIPPLGPLDIRINMPKKPRTVTLQPDNRPLRFSYSDGVLLFTVPETAIYSLAEIR